MDLPDTAPGRDVGASTEMFEGAPPASMITDDKYRESLRLKPFMLLRPWRRSSLQHQRSFGEQNTPYGFRKYARRLDRPSHQSCCKRPTVSSRPHTGPRSSCSCMDYSRLVGTVAAIKALTFRAIGRISTLRTRSQRPFTQSCICGRICSPILLMHSFIPPDAPAPRHMLEI
jgi:hypothetical protein